MQGLAAGLSQELCEDLTRAERKLELITSPRRSDSEESLWTFVPPEPGTGVARMLTFNTSAVSSYSCLQKQGHLHVSVKFLNANLKEQKINQKIIEKLNGSNLPLFISLFFSPKKHLRKKRVFK